MAGKAAPRHLETIMGAVEERIKMLARSSDNDASKEHTARLEELIDEMNRAVRRGNRPVETPAETAGAQ